jgi:predicted TIM-barrel fold metal-dependent hydrolase
MRAVDAHAHVCPQYARLAVEVMDRCEIEWIVTLEWHDGFGEILRNHLEMFGRYPGRFVVFGNVDFRRINEPDFGTWAAEGIRRDVAAGMAGLKIYKALGMEYRQPDSQFWRINDERLDPIWNAAGECGIPVLIHTADPAEFWQPVNDRNPWSGVLYGEYAWWTYYRKCFPCRDELLAERNEVIARHPRTRFICPHFGSNSENLDQAAEDLSAYPNLFYDLSARLPELTSSPRRRERARQIIVEFQDRILFGTDVIYDDTNIPTGMQAQCLYQPFEIPLREADCLQRYVETTVDFIQFHYQFLKSDELFDHPPFKRIKGHFSMQGLGLPPEVCAKLLYENAEKFIRHQI